ncbi:MAG: hypothetical protein Q8930_08725 [Bacillota bacterium]|nr:hypothetical protein [Bacillota bacterium]
MDRKDRLSSFVGVNEEKVSFVKKEKQNIAIRQITSHIDIYINI